MATKLAELLIIEKKIEKKISLPKPITWEHFKNRYLSREDEFTYEWVNGYVEKTKREFGYRHLYIFKNLTDTFINFNCQQKGSLTKDIATFFLADYLQPDISFFTKEQIRTTNRNEYQTPKFVIEIISNNDKAKKLQGKMVDYLRADVLVIWQIYPDLQVVHVYNGNKMTLLMNDDLCSAAPVLPEFVISVNDIFK